MGLTKIEWTSAPRTDGTLMPGYTANLWWGCTKVTAGCDHCYAETLSNRWDFHVWGNENPRREIKSVWKDLAKFQKLAQEANEIHRVFVGSMMDIFEKPMPLAEPTSHMWLHSTGDLRDYFFNKVVPNSPNLMYLLLTKRPSNINKYIPEEWKISPPQNIMFGTSPCDQETFDTLVPQLMKVNGKHFLSIEPLLGPVDITKDYPTGKGSVQYGLLTDWIIIGGESGPGKRPMKIEWAESLRDQCVQFEIPFFMKQIDKVIPIPDDLLTRQFPKL